MSMKKKRSKSYVERTPENPIFLNEIAQKAIKKEAWIWHKRITSLEIEASKGKPDVTGPEPFEPDFYEFVDLYRSGMTIIKLAHHYSVSESTIKRYMSRNFVTKKPIDPQEYLMAHERLHGKDASYWNIRSELITEFDVD